MAQKGLKPARGHSGSKDDGMLFGDADIEVALGMMRAEKIESRCRWAWRQ